jgi:pimeloyl-ACP methyl ester carboxylesterase
MDGCGRRSWAAQVIACVAMLSLASGCAFRTLKKDLEAAGKQAALEGHAGIRGRETGAIVVVVYSVQSGRIADFFLLPHQGPFFFALPAGTYQLAAFEDRNHDLSYQPAEEPAALFGAPTDLALRPGQRRTGLELSIDPNGSARIPFAVSARVPGQRGINQLPALQLGAIAKLDDPRFSAENAKLGLWHPLRFLFDVGAGVYFLEAYDPHKIPILFVHGAVGHPGIWKYLATTIDRSRFQPWFVYYPTAPHLEAIARAVVRTIEALQVKYGFSQMILVAHSMGGLVTRAAINYAVETARTGRVVRLPAFISISSPWNGHAAAAEGVKYAPVVAPSWEDMAPGSPFLVALPKTALPPECEYSLFFSYRGRRKFSGEANDGAVAVSSELSMPIQLQAVHVMGFNESHRSILESPEVARQLNVILGRADLVQP